MTRKWNGNLLDNNYAGDALATIVTEYVALPCAILTTIGALWWVYTSGASWGFYPLALIAGPIAGFFAAAGIGLASVALLAILVLVILPFKIGFSRLAGRYKERHEHER